MIWCVILYCMREVPKLLQALGLPWSVVNAVYVPICYHSAFGVDLKLIFQGFIKELAFINQPSVVVICFDLSPCHIRCFYFGLLKGYGFGGFYVGDGRFFRGIGGKAVFGVVVPADDGSGASVDLVLVFFLVLDRKSVV